MTQLRDDLAEHPEQAPLDALEAAREEAAALGDLAGKQAKLDREISALDTNLNRDASALWGGDVEDLAALRIPLTTTLREFEAEYRRLEDALRTIQDKDDDLVRDITERERELRGLTAAGEIATYEQVQAVRLRRDDGWHLIRQGYIEKTGDPEKLSADFSPDLPLPTAYEGAVREADRLADLLHADAERAVIFETTRQRVEEMQSTRSALSRQQDGLAEELRQTNARWGTIAASLGQPDITPTAALEWCQKHAAWVDRYTQLGEQRQEKQETSTLLAKTRNDLSQALIACGLNGITEQETLVAALTRVRAAVEAVRQAATTRAALVGQIKQQERDEKNTLSQQSQLDEKIKGWQTQWNETIAILHVQAGALPPESRARIDELVALESELNELDELTREAELERSKKDTFEGALSSLASAVGELTSAVIRTVHNPLLRLVLDFFQIDFCSLLGLHSRQSSTQGVDGGSW